MVQEHDLPPSFPPGYQAARSGAALIDRADRGRLIVSGPDRAAYLQGLLTNDVAALTAGHGCYAAYLTPQGRMIADLLVYELGDVMLLVLSKSVKDAVLDRLNQFIFSEDVTLGDVSETFTQVAVIGPDAARRLGGGRVLQGTSTEALAALPEHGAARVRFAEQPAIVTRITDTGEPGFDVYVEHPRAAALAAALSAAGIVALDGELAEAIRIEAGVPLFGRDMDEETIPLEAGIESRAISFTKGCYVGQEVIIRVLHRGHGRVARKLTGLVLDGDSRPAPGTAVRALSPDEDRYGGRDEGRDEARDQARDIGSVTSAAWSPALTRPIALAYLHRDFLTAGTPVSVDGNRGVVTALPFVRQ